jgi:hypothetical protein
MSALDASNPVLKNLFADSKRISELLSLRVRKLLRSIQFSFPRPDLLWNDLFDAKGGDVSAASRVALRITWHPNQWQRECIRLKSRLEGNSPGNVRQEALTQGVFLALGWEKEAEVPIQIGPASTWLYDERQNLATVAPMHLPVHLFWEWIKEEAPRAAGLWLVGYPYAPSVVLEAPPEESSDWKLAKFTSRPLEDQSTYTLRGRPYGSGIFENRLAFLEEIRLAVAQVNARGDPIPQERVAEVLSQKALAGAANPERQLRRWVKEFGYANWRSLLNSL